MANGKITYILGAGASIGAFPLVKATKEWRDNSLANKIKELGNNLNDKVGIPYLKKYKETIRDLATSLIKTGTEADKFGNVDSYAKYLYHIKEEKKLSQLKLALTYYFTYNQICKRTSLNEKRYLNFITSLIDDKHEFPSHVKILNWNYDYLLELESSIYNIIFDQEFGKGKPIINSFPFVGYEFNKLYNLKIGTEISHIHLNGIAGFYSEKIEVNGN